MCGDVTKVQEYTGIRVNSAGRQVVAGVLSAGAGSIHNPESGTQKGVSSPPLGGM